MSEDWKDRARKILKTYYLSFNGIQWHEFATNSDSELLKVKICYAIFGPPTNANSSTIIEEAYSDEQKEKAQKIIEKILQVKRNKTSSSLHIGFTFVVCHQEGTSIDFCQPVFSVLVRNETGKDKRSFVDMQGRIYKTWDDWKSNNCLPQVEIAYPAYGYFACDEDGSYVFDGERDPIIDFGESPQCNAWSTTNTDKDVVTAAMFLGCAAIGIALMFRPITPVVLTAAFAIAGGISAFHEAARRPGVVALVDKETHEQILKNLETTILWRDIVATPLNFASSAVAGIPEQGAVLKRRFFSQRMRTIASVLLCTTNLDTALISISLVNLIKITQRKELNALDVLRFSTSVFFFSNTLIQPKTVRGVFKRAQKMHFDQMANSMTDETAKATCYSLLQTTKIDGTIQDRFKIVRTIKRMNDPNNFFKAAATSNLKVYSTFVGGTKGTTIIPNDQRKYYRVKNKGHFVETNIAFTPAEVFQNASSNQLHKDLAKTVRHHFGKKASKVTLNGKRIFDNLNDLQKKKVIRKLVTAAKTEPNIVNIAHNIATKMFCTTLEEYLSIVQIITNEAKELTVSWYPEVTIAEISQSSSEKTQTLQDSEDETDKASSVHTPKFWIPSPKANKTKQQPSQNSNKVY